VFCDLTVCVLIEACTSLVARYLPVGHPAGDYDQSGYICMMSGFFEELKRRKVYRVAIAYVVASWALAQGLAQVLPVFDIPNSVIRVVIALMLTGFPVALALAWVYDITPQGVRATPAPTMPRSHRRRNLLILIAVGVVISASVGFFLLPRAV